MASELGPDFNNICFVACGTRYPITWCCQSSIRLQQFLPAAIREHRRDNWSERAFEKARRGGINFSGILGRGDGDDTDAQPD